MQGFHCHFITILHFFSLSSCGTAVILFVSHGRIHTCEAACLSNHSALRYYDSFKSVRICRGGVFASCIIDFFPCKIGEFLPILTYFFSSMASYYDLRRGGVVLS